METVKVVSNLDTLFSSSVSAKEEEALAVKAQHDLHRRLVDEKKMVELLSAAHDTQEQLYAVRWSTSLDRPAKRAQVLELRRRLVSLERSMADLRREAARSFDASLALESLGLGPSELYETDRLASSGRDDQVDPYVAMTKSIAHAAEQADDQDLESIKMIRVASADLVKDMKPGEKFAHLYGMYSETKQEDTQQLRHSALTEEQKIKLRGQIYALKQHTHLSQEDKIRLAELQAQLKAAN